jgi:hypothetical protein
VTGIPLRLALPLVAIRNTFCADHREDRAKPVYKSRSDRSPRRRPVRRTVFLDAEADVEVLLVSGVRVEVVRRAAVELVPQTHLAADEEPESHCAKPG